MGGVVGLWREREADLNILFFFVFLGVCGIGDVEGSEVGWDGCQGISGGGEVR